MKGIKISLKISVLVILISLVAVAAISFFTYDFNLKTNREKITNNLNVITEHRAAQSNLFFDKVTYSMSQLQAADPLKGSTDAAAPPSDFGFDIPAETRQIQQQTHPHQQNLPHLRLKISSTPKRTC